jgi:fructose-specific phosphotransferase system IIC component
MNRFQFLAAIITALFFLFFVLPLVASMTAFSSHLREMCHAPYYAVKAVDGTIICVKAQAPI